MQRRRQGVLESGYRKVELKGGMHKAKAEDPQDFTGNMWASNKEYGFQETNLTSSLFANM